MLEVRGIIKAFSMDECVGILCLIIKFANMAYYFWLNQVLCQIDEKPPFNVINLLRKPVNQQIS